MAVSNLLKVAPLLALLLLTFSLKAKTWIPADDDVHVMSLKGESRLPVALQQHIKQWEQAAQQDNTAQISAKLDLQQSYASAARLPGFDDLNFKASHLLKELMHLFNTAPERFSPQHTARLYSAQAEQLQREHNFIEAIEWLQKINVSQLEYVSAQLAIARAAQLNNQPQQAKSSCAKLLGTAHLQLSQLCFIDQQITEHGSLTPQLHQQLKRLAQSPNQPVEIERWIKRLLGELAMAEKDYSLAVEHFQYQLDTADTSQWLQWADASLEANKPQHVLQKLADIAQQYDVADSLLLRLARAEKILGENNNWQTAANQKIKLRELRQDKVHAADLAYFYLYITESAQQAKYWANINYQAVKEPTDLLLWKRANHLEESL